MRVFIGSGEVSGDLAGAGLARALKRRDPEVVLFGIGGSHMQAAGVEIDIPSNHLGIVGVSEAVSVIPSLWRVFKSVRGRVASTRPDVAVLIGNDVFSVFLARWFRARGIPTSAFFPPQVWIWGAIAAWIVRSFDVVFTCFPREQDVYSRAARRSGTSVEFVGHFMADELKQRSDNDRSRARRRLGFAQSDRVVCVMPGSRQQELRALSPVLFGAARELVNRDDELRIIVPVAQPQFRAGIRAEVDRQVLGDVVTLADCSVDAIMAADLVMMASGTASLEAALLGVPMVVVYKVSGVTHLIVKTAIRLGLIERDRVALPNLVLERQVVPELKQDRVELGAVAREAWSILVDPTRQQAMRRSLAEIPARVRGPNSFDRVTAGVLALAAGSSAGLETSESGQGTNSRGVGGILDHGTSLRRAASVESDRPPRSESRGSSR
jgi:lipid-A-disaccharide synthase